SSRAFASRLASWKLTNTRSVRAPGTTESRKGTTWAEARRGSTGTPESRILASRASKARGRRRRLGEYEEAERRSPERLGRSRRLLRGGPVGGLTVLGRIGS